MFRNSFKKFFRLFFRNWFISLFILGLITGYGIVCLSGIQYSAAQLSEASAGQSEFDSNKESGSDFYAPQIHRNRFTLFISVIQHRIPYFILLLICGATAATAPIYILFVCYAGITQGILLTMYIFREGWHGLWTYLTMLMPHSICYSIAYVLLLKYPWRSIPYRKHSRILFFMFISLSFGVLLEVYTNYSLSAL